MVLREQAVTVYDRDEVVRQVGGVESFLPRPFKDLGNGLGVGAEVAEETTVALQEVGGGDSLRGVEEDYRVGFSARSHPVCRW